MFAVTATLLLAYRYWRPPSWRRLALVGLAVRRGRAGVIRADPARPARRRSAGVVDARSSGGVSGCAGSAPRSRPPRCVIAPWTIYNTTRSCTRSCSARRLIRSLASANCDSVVLRRLPGLFRHPVRGRDRRQEGRTDPARTTSHRRTSSTGARRSRTCAGTSAASRSSKACGSCASSACTRPSLYVRADTLHRGPRPAVDLVGRAVHLLGPRAVVDRGRGRAATPRRCSRTTAPAAVPVARTGRRRVRRPSLSRTRARGFAPPRSRRSRCLPRSRSTPMLGRLGRGYASARN